MHRDVQKLAHGRAAGGSEAGGRPGDLLAGQPPTPCCLQLADTGFLQMVKDLPVQAMQLCPCGFVRFYSIRMAFTKSQAPRKQR